MRRWRHVLILGFSLLILSGCGASQTAAPPDAAQPELPLESDARPEAESPPEPPSEAEVLPEAPPEPEAADFVRVTAYLPEIQVDLQYASADNFTGQTIYDFTDAYLRYGTVQKLSAALDALREEGYTLLIWDAFRPTAAQFRLWEICPDPVYVANPEKGFSSHSRGNTVDLTLVTPAGEPVEMPTGFDDFSPLADRDYRDVPEPAASHARLLEDVMTDCGFRPYAGEWWHFSDTDDYPVEETWTPN